MDQVRQRPKTSRENTAATFVYHVIFDFLKHVIIGHDEVLGCVAISNVGQDTQRLTKEKNSVSYKNGIYQVNKTENKPAITNKVLMNICFTCSLTSML